MSVISALLGTMGLLSIIYVVLIVARLSQKLGAVTKMKLYYRGLYLALALLFIALVAHFLKSSVIYAPHVTPRFLTTDLFYVLTYYLPFSISMTITLAITAKYWGWLLRE